MVLQSAIAIMTFVLVYFAYADLGPKLSGIRAATALKITYPRTGTPVGLYEPVAGTFIAPGGIVTLVVRDKRGTPYSQDFESLDTKVTGFAFKRVPDERGEWLLPAQFGEQAEGCGEPFFLRAIWTKTEPKPGMLLDIGEDTIVSEEIALLRVCGD